MNNLHQKLFATTLALIITAAYIVNAQLTNNATIHNTGYISTTKIWAKSGYWRDIQDAVDVVANTGGGNVYIPAGTWNFVNVGENWSGARVVVPAGVNIFGAPTERTSGLPYDGVGQNPNDQVVEWKTVLVIPWDVPSTWSGLNAMFKLTGGISTNTKSCRVSDIKFVGYRYFNSSSRGVPLGIHIENIPNYRIDHCYFLDISGGAVQEPLWYHLHSYGVIDHCYIVNTYGVVVANFDDCTVGYGVGLQRAFGDYWDDNITNVLGCYTNYTTFIEDCYFSKWRHCVAANNGKHYVFRHNTIENDFGFGSLDAHGWGVYGEGGKVIEVGTRAVEIYGNIIVNATQNVWATFIRGGAGVAFNNTVGGGTYVYFISFAQESQVPKCQINDWYIWNNTMLNNCIELPEDPEPPIEQNVNYFLYAPSWYKPYPYPHPLTSETRSK